MTRHALAALALSAALPLPLHAQTVTLDAPGAPPATLSAETLRALPQATATLAYGNPPAPHQLQGPLLWTILTRAHAIDPDKHAAIVRQTLAIQGADGYVAVLAMGELSPDFEEKPALLALSADGKPLDRPRAVVPNDHRAGRSVRDVVALRLDEHPRP